MRWEYEKEVGDYGGGDAADVTCSTYIHLL